MLSHVKIKGAKISNAKKGIRKGRCSHIKVREREQRVHKSNVEWRGGGKNGRKRGEVLLIGKGGVGGLVSEGHTILGKERIEI